jgi:hypothetical protein
MSIAIPVAVDCIKCRNTYYVNCNREDFNAWRNGTLIQNAMPYLSIDDRELFISGICTHCYSKMFPPYCGDCLVPITDCSHKGEVNASFNS